RDVHLNYHLLKRGKGYYMKEVFGAYHIHQGGVFSLKSKEEKVKIAYLVYRDLFIKNKNDKLLNTIYTSSLKNVIKAKKRNKDLVFNINKLYLELLYATRSVAKFKSNFKFILKIYFQ